MPQSSLDQGVIQVLLDRFNQQRLPRAMEMKEKVDRGEKLEEFDVSYLAGVLEDIQQIRPLLERHPEYEPLVVKGLALYKEIVDKATQNESN
jgi:hypothetical protein